MQPSNDYRKSLIVEAFAKRFYHVSQLREHWAIYLAMMDWRHFVTLTFASAISVGRARHQFVDGFVRRCAFHALTPIPWFYAIERDAVGDRIHVHALIAATGTLTVARMEENWNAGCSRIRIYDRARRAAWYVVKTVGTDEAEYDISRRLPPRVFGTDS